MFENDLSDKIVFFARLEFLEFHVFFDSMHMHEVPMGTKEVKKTDVQLYML